MQFGPDFDALVSRFSPETQDPIAVAVSGGSDSVALLGLAHAWAMRTQRRLLAFTVNHQLRPEAAQEADWVRRHCIDLGVEHQTLHWQAPKATQSAARSARYRLLADAARGSKAKTLLVGHTLDDVIETALIRRRRGVRDATAAGPVLAAPAPVWPEGRRVTVLRPLLQIRREALRACLQANDQAWIDDPSNQSNAFERIRIRKRLAKSARLKALAETQVLRLQTARFEPDAKLGDWLNQCQVRPDGLIESPMGDAPPRGGLYLLDVVPDGDVRFGFPNINDNAEIAELMACGAHMTYFVTGRGSVVGSAISPVLKICANPETYARMADDMDVDAGRVLRGAPLAEVGDEIHAKTLETAAGARTRSEAQSLLTTARRRAACITLHTSPITH